MAGLWRAGGLFAAIMPLAGETATIRISCGEMPTRITCRAPYIYGPIVTILKVFR